MTGLYIIRHAEAEGNLYRRIHGQYDSLVTDMGLLQIEALRRRFETVRIDAVYSSDLLRTRMTAEAIYMAKGLPLHLDPALREVNMGVWEDRCWADIERFDPEQYYRYNNAPHLWNIEGAENYFRLAARITGAVTEIAKRHDGQSVAIVTHGGAIRTFLCSLLGYPPEDIGRVQYCDNTAVSLISCQDGKFTVVYMNDNTHLPNELSAFYQQTWWKEKDCSDGRNMRYAPMDLRLNAARYLDYYQDAWLCAHGSMDGYSDVYLSIARAHSSACPESVAEAFLGDEPAGMIELAEARDAGDGAGCIAFYYLREKFRGRGLAVQLLGYATSFYRSRGRRTLRLRVAESNARAVSFYAKYGFRRIGTEEGAVSALIVMEKNIAL